MAISPAPRPPPYPAMLEQGSAGVIATMPAGVPLRPYLFRRRWLLTDQSRHILGPPSRAHHNILCARFRRRSLPLQIDVGFGDTPAPAPELIEYPATLDLPAARLREYRRETVIAEKFNAMVELGLRNTRLKDFYDLWALAGSCDFEGEVLSEALRATFARGRTPLPTAAPISLTGEFAGEQVKQNQWRAFVRRGKLRAGDAPLGEIVTVLHGFLMPVVEALNAGSPFNRRWRAGGPWGE